MKKITALLLLTAFVLCLFGCAASKQSGKTQEPDAEQENVLTNQESPSTEAVKVYTYEELSEMPAKELLDLFIQNGLVISDEIKAHYTDEELQKLFKENFSLWHTGLSAHSYTIYIDLAEQTKEIYDRITASQS